MPTSKTVKFHLIHDFPDQIVLPPIPSKKVVPTWFKHIPRKVDDPRLGNIQSVKACMPFLDAMTSGYTLLAHMDILVELKEDDTIRLPYIDDQHQKLVEKWRPIERHPGSQVQGAVFQNMTILKYMNPWVIETPKDYSMLFIPPANQLENSIIPLVGLVDTDDYPNVINIPFIHTELEVGNPIFIPAGTPICQMIPVKRDTWTQKVTVLDKQELKNVQRMRTKMDKDREDYYAKNIHEKKGYN